MQITTQVGTDYIIMYAQQSGLKVYFFTLFIMKHSLCLNPTPQLYNIAETY
jgi:hypothetical protein